jgi:hypothetical protein
MSGRRTSILAVWAAICPIFARDGASAQTSVPNDGGGRGATTASTRGDVGAFPILKTFSVDQTPGSRVEVQAKHFAAGATHDQIAVKH